MKHIKAYKKFESKSNGIDKSYLVDRIKWYSNYLHQYMKDVNKYTTSNLNFSFSYGTQLTISEIFDTANKLDYNSPDGFITAICNEFIVWSNYMVDHVSSRIASDLVDFRIDKGYDDYTDDYKKEHRSELYYSQSTRSLMYAAVGRDIKNSISGTIWDIPVKRKLTDEDKEFVIDSIISDLEIEYVNDYINSIKYNLISPPINKKGTIILMPIFSDKDSIKYGSDFINRLQSYFSGALILNINYSIRIYLPFII
jgi:hypothetical protein